MFTRTRRPRRLLELGAQLVDVGAAAADDDARLRRVDRHGHLVRVAVDLDARDAGVDGRRSMIRLRIAMSSWSCVLVVLAGVPLALPVVDDADAEAGGVYFVSQTYSSSTTTVT